MITCTVSGAFISRYIGPLCCKDNPCTNIFLRCPSLFGGLWSHQMGGLGLIRVYTDELTTTPTRNPTDIQLLNSRPSDVLQWINSKTFTLNSFTIIHPGDRWRAAKTPCGHGYVTGCALLQGLTTNALAISVVFRILTSHHGSEIRNTLS